MDGSQDTSADQSPVPPRRQAVAAPDSTSERAPVSWQELVAVGSIVLLAEVTLYRGHGYAGCALFFLLAPAFLLAGMKSWRQTPSV